MPEELSPESKLYLKEELEKSRKEIKEEVEKVKSKVTKTFTTIAMIIGFLTGVGVYSFAKDYMKTTIQTAIDDKLGEQAVKEFKQRVIQAEGLVSDANDLHTKIVKYEKDANEILSKLGRFKRDPNGYARFGEIMFSWGTFQVPATLPQFYHSFKYPFDTNCLVVIFDEPGYVTFKNREKFILKQTLDINRINANIGKKKQISYLAIGY